MALAPAATPILPAASPGGGMGGDAGAGADERVVVTICSDGQGGYTVYPGDEPEGGGADMSEADVSAMGPAGAAPAPGGGAAAPQGVPADSMGAALKAAMDIMQSDASSAGAPGSADDQFASGFSADKAPTPVLGPAQKF